MLLSVMEKKMIKSKEDLKFYLEEDRKAYRKPKKKTIPQKIKGLIFKDRFYNYMRTLRKLEYAQNTGKITKYYYAHKLGRLKEKTGIDLDPNVVGPGCHIVHGKCVINCYSKIGANCTIMSDVTVGISNMSDERTMTPIIGDNCIIGSGARILGAIHIADNVTIGANAVVCKSIEESGVVVAGIPARIIKRNNEE